MAASWQQQCNGAPGWRRGARLPHALQGGGDEVGAPQRGLPPQQRREADDAGGEALRTGRRCSAAASQHEISPSKDVRLLLARKFTEHHSFDEFDWYQHRDVSRTSIFLILLCRYRRYR